MKKVLFLDTVHPIIKDRLTQMGFSLVEDYTSTKEIVEQKIGDYTGIVIRSRFVLDKVFLSKAINLRFIARSGSGMENIDKSHAEAKGVRCFNSPEGNRDAVAEHALAMLLSLFNKLNSGDAHVRKGLWHREKHRGVELKGKTIGIIGYGFMGEAFSRRLSGFDVQVLAYDKYKKNFSTTWVKEVELNEIFEKADVLSIHLPLTEETNYYVNTSFIHAFKKNFYLLNTSRGEVVKTEDVVQALKQGKIQGACLDVLEYESKSFENIQADSLPQAFSELIAMENVLLSPHVAGWTVESYEKLSSVLADKIEADLAYILA